MARYLKWSERSCMQRVIEAEWLDELSPDDEGAAGSRKDLQRLNAWMGSARRLANSLRTALDSGARCRLADLGGGDGRCFLNTARRLKTPARAGQVTIVDRQNIVSTQTQLSLQDCGWEVRVAQADVFAWLRQQNNQVWDIIVTNLFLHHFNDEQVSRFLGGVSKITRMFVALEPRRSRLALAFSRCVGLLGCNHVTRHDAPASVRAGFSEKDLSRLWPRDENWALAEHRAGWFGHVFVARCTKPPCLDHARSDTDGTETKALAPALS